jgi:hypothetical protein
LKNGDVFAFSGRVYPITTMARVGGWSDYKWDFTTSCWLALVWHCPIFPLFCSLNCPALFVVSCLQPLSALFFQRCRLL